MKNIYIAAILIYAATASASAQEKQVFKARDWTVMQSVDTMTDKKDCTAIYKNNWRIQGKAQKFYISMKGQGNVSAYTLRLDDAPAEPLQMASGLEQHLSAVVLSDKSESLYQAKRLRIQILNLLKDVETMDINLSGFRESVDFMRSNNC